MHRNINVDRESIVGIALGVLQFIAPRLIQFELAQNRNICLRTKGRGLMQERPCPTTLSRRADFHFPGVSRSFVIINGRWANLRKY